MWLPACTSKQMYTLLGECKVDRQSHWQFILSIAAPFWLSSSRFEVCWHRQEAHVHRVWTRQAYCRLKVGREAGMWSQGQLAGSGHSVRAAPATDGAKLQG